MGNQTESNFKPRDEHKYRMYLIWKNMPVKWLGMARQHLQNMGIQDEEILELSDIETQKDFAEKFEMNETTLVIWNKKKPPAEFQDIDWRKWAVGLTKNVVSTLYDKIEEEGDAARVKLWLQAVDGYVEEQNINHDITAETLVSVRELVEGMNEKKEKEPVNSGANDE